MNKTPVFPFLFGLLVMLSSAATAQSPEPTEQSPVRLVYALSKTRVALQKPNGTLEQLLAEFTRQTHPATTLTARGVLARTPLLCFCRQARLPDVLEVLSLLLGRSWKQTGKDTLSLAEEPDKTPFSTDEATDQAHVQHFLYEVDRQPAQLRIEMAAHPLRIASLPPEVQHQLEQLVAGKQSLLRHALFAQTMSSDLSQSGVQLRRTGVDSAAPREIVSIIMLRDEPGGRTREDVLNIPLDLAEAEHISVLAADKIENGQAAAEKQLAQPVTLHLKQATLAEALEALAKQTQTDIIATDPGPLRADVDLAILPLREALNRLAETYGYVWEQPENGIVALWVEPATYQAAITKAGQELLTQYDNLSADLRNALDARGFALALLPQPMQQTLSTLLATPKPTALLEEKELPVFSIASHTPALTVRIQFLATGETPLMIVLAGSDKQGWRKITFPAAK